MVGITSRASFRSLTPMLSVESLRSVARPTVPSLACPLGVWWLALASPAITALNAWTREPRVRTMVSAPEDLDRLRV